MVNLANPPFAGEVFNWNKLEQSWSARLNTPWRIVLIAAIAYTSFLGSFLYHRVHVLGMRRQDAIRRFDYSSTVQAGDNFADPARVPPHLSVRKGSGFDGQFFYRLSLNPLTTRRTQYGITIDAPAYRQERILYPLIT